MARSIQLAPRVQIGPVTDFVVPQAITVGATEREWRARLDPAQEYPTCVWTVVLEWSFDNQATWAHWRSIGPITGITLTEKGLYPAIGGTFPPGAQPTHLRGRITLSERVSCGLTAVTQ